jgi:ferrous iron transport protein A
VDNDEPVGVLTGGGGPDVSVSVNWPYARAMDGLAGDRNAPDRAGTAMPCQYAPYIPLTEAPLGRHVYLVSSGARGLLGRRLVDLGFTAGARMRLVRKGPAESLIAVSIRNTVIALRSSEAKSIIVSESRG